MELYLTLGGVLLSYNLLVFSIYGYDKRCAQEGRWRVPEKVLLTFALFLGGLGALFGMAVYRHKTRHVKFQILVPLFTIIQLVILVGTINGFK